MKHDWFDPVHRSVATFLTPPMRECRNCGKVQTRVTNHCWMRVTGYRWEPLAGRCKP